MQRLARSLSSSSAAFSISSRGRPCTQSRRHSVVASDDSSTPPQKRVRVKVSRSERRSLVESFVKKYREMNVDKFPTPSHVTSAVGGSYYFVKKIVQELQHESQKPSANNKKLVDEIIKKESEPSSGSIEDSSGQTIACEEISVNEQDNKGGIGLKMGDDDVYTKDCEIEIEIETQSEVTEIVDVKNEESRLDTQLQGSDVSRTEEIRHLRNIEKEEEGEKKSFVWKHMKPLADVFLRIWRKL